MHVFLSYGAGINKVFFEKDQMVNNLDYVATVAVQ